MSELSVGALSGLAANSYVIDVASGSTLDVTNATGTLPAAQLPAGSILQVVSTIKLDTFTSATSTFTDVPGLSVSITPSSASSKILVNVTVSGITGDSSGSGGSGFILVRDSTPIAVSTGGSSHNFTGHLSSRSVGSTAISLNSAAMTLDSPATTSSTTYKVQVSANANTIYVNRDVDNVGSVSTITVMEVAG